MPDLITRCPSCSVTFHVKAVTLLPAKGMVRCGICQHQFNAMTHAIAKQEILDSGPSQKELDEDDLLIYDDMPLEDEQPDAPPPSHTGTPVTAPDKSQLPLSAKEQEQEQEQEQDKSVKPVLADEKPLFKPLAPSEFAEEPDYQPATERQPRNSVYRLLFGLTACALMLLLLLQYVHFNAISLGNNPLLSASIKKLCAVTGCDPIYRDLQLLEIRNLVVSDHPDVDDALQITGQLGNLAPYRQPLPRVVVAFEDLNGNTVLRRAFLPAEYLSDPVPEEFLQGRHQVYFRLDIIDPGEQAVSYTLSLE